MAHEGLPSMLDEIADTIERLRCRFEALAIRGIRAAGPDDIALLKSAGEEFERIGASHMAERIGEFIGAMQEGGREAAVALLRAQVSLRLFDRVLTLDVAEGALSSLADADEVEEESHP
jgi:hypothetical protein